MHKKHASKSSPHAAQPQHGSMSAEVMDVMHIFSKIADTRDLELMVLSALLASGLSGMLLGTTDKLGMVLNFFISCGAFLAASGIQQFFFSH